MLWISFTFFFSRVARPVAAQKRKRSELIHSINTYEESFSFEKNIRRQVVTIRLSSATFPLSLISQKIKIGITNRILSETLTFKFKWK